MSKKGKTKRFYWLKLHRDFFKRHDIRVVETMENGTEYILFYMKLLLESIDHEGYLRFSETIPYNDKMLAVITNTNIDIVRSAIKVFQELKLMEILDDETIYLQQTQKMIGHETQWARYKREQRERENQEKLEQKETPKLEYVQSMSKDVQQEIDIDIELDIYKDKDIGQKNDQNDTQVIKNDISLNELFDTFWKSYPKKVGKQSCLNWFKRKKPNQELVDKMISKVNEYKQTKQWQTKQYIPNPLTWLNQGRWEDEIVIEKENETSEEFEKLNFRTIGEK